MFFMSLIKELKQLQSLKLSPRNLDLIVLYALVVFLIYLWQLKYLYKLLNDRICRQSHGVKIDSC